MNDNIKDMLVLPKGCFLGPERTITPVELHKFYYPGQRNSLDVEYYTGLIKNHREAFVNSGGQIISSVVRVSPGVPVGLGEIWDKKGIGEGYLGNLWVDPNFRERGVARAILGDIVNYADVHDLPLRVEVKDSRLRPLYTSYDFIANDESPGVLHRAVRANVE